MKLDLGQMTKDEFTHMLETATLEDRSNPRPFRPLVAIGHTKDLIDSEKVETILAFLNKKGIKVTDFADVYRRCECGI
ncbi:MAG: hypothetical protein AB9866_04525 [Syntrophobacteraceae bacterium]